MATTVLIDNCVWDLLWRRGVQLRDEQGGDLTFTVSPYGTQEIPPADHPNTKARAVGDYAREQLAELRAQEATWFCFGDLDDPTAGSGGFGDLQDDGTVVGGGFLTSVEGQDFRNANQHRIGGDSGTKVMKSGLPKNQTDVDYGEWSFGLPVVTLNAKDYKGAGKVIDLSGWSTGSFGDFIRSHLAAPAGTAFGRGRFGPCTPKP